MGTTVFSNLDLSKIVAENHFTSIDAIKFSEDRKLDKNIKIEDVKMFWNLGLPPALHLPCSTSRKIGKLGLFGKAAIYTFSFFKQNCVGIRNWLPCYYSFFQNRFYKCVSAQWLLRIYATWKFNSICIQLILFDPSNACGM